MPAVVLAAALAAAATACSSSSSTGTSGDATGKGSPGASAPASASTSPAITSPVTGEAATELLAQAVIDTEAATSVVVKADNLSDGNGGQAISVDMTMVQKVGCQGSVAESKTATVQVVIRNGYTWMKPSAGFYQTLDLTQAEIELIDGRWIKVKSTDPQISGMSGVCGFSSMFGSMGTPTGNDYVDTPTTYDGQKVYKVTQTGQAGYVYLTNSITPTLVELNVPAKTGGAIMITAYGKALAITEPSAAETIDGSAFGF